MILRYVTQQISVLIFSKIFLARILNFGHNISVFIRILAFLMSTFLIKEIDTDNKVKI